MQKSILSARSFCRPLWLGNWYEFLPFCEFMKAHLCHSSFDLLCTSSKKVLIWQDKHKNMKTYFLLVLMVLLVRIGGNRQEVKAELIQRTMRDGVIPIIVADGQIMPTIERFMPEASSISSMFRARLMLKHRWTQKFSVRGKINRRKFNIIMSITQEILIIKVYTSNLKCTL